MTDLPATEAQGAGERRVVFTPSGIDVSVPAGTSVLDAARSGGVDLDSVCGGRGLCGRCQVVPALGRHAKWAITATAEALTAPGGVERDYRGRRPLATGHRLGCQAFVVADMVVDVPAASAVRRPVVRKAIDLGDVVLDPVVTLHYLELPPTVLGDEVSDAERVTTALARDWGLGDVAVPLAVLADLHAAIAAGNGSVTAVVHSGRRLLTVRPGYSDGAWGVAIDVGSTTLAGYLLDLATGEVVGTAGRMNPQIRFGEDLMSRVSYVMMNPGGAVALTEAVRGALDELVGELTEGGSVPREHVHDIVVVGNPIMHHLVLGLDPTPLGTAPFTLAVRRAVHAAAADHRPRTAPCVALRGAVHRRPRRCRLGGRHPRRGAAPGRVADAAGGPWARTPRSCWATASGSSRPRARRDRPSRAPRSAAGSAPPRVRSSGSASILPASNPASR